MLYFCTMSRLLAIDYGQKRVGIAVTDNEQIIASALTTLNSKEVMSFLKDYLSKEYKHFNSQIIDLDDKLTISDEKNSFSGDDLRRRQYTFGISLEDLELILHPMAEDAKEATGSMGDDTPLAVLSDRYRPLYHFFRQNFSQVTNPPIDSLRENKVMSLKTRFGNLGNILNFDNLTKQNIYAVSYTHLTLPTRLSV